ncbi:MAG: hypothetical protein M1281_07260 [Chloroflexi bacterium]|nr:hypothetical protein [Chloroflexota bacterium]
MPPAFPEYRTSPQIVRRLLWSMLIGKKRSFREDALALIRGVSSLQICGQIPDLNSFPHGCVITVNHYFRPGFGAWWIAIAISAAIPTEIHWVMSSAWTSPNPWVDHVKVPLTSLVFKRLASTYRFTSMPPMPPRDQDARERGLAVMDIIRHAQRHDRPVIGFAPEGMDPLNGHIGEPAQGAGRLLGFLSGLGLAMVPAGLYEAGGTLRLRFGAPYYLPERYTSALKEQDASISQHVLAAISTCLPPSSGLRVTAA